MNIFSTKPKIDSYHQNTMLEKLINNPKLKEQVLGLHNTQNKFAGFCYGHSLMFAQLFLHNKEKNFVKQNTGLNVFDPAPFSYCKNFTDDSIDITTKIQFFIDAFEMQDLHNHSITLGKLYESFNLYRKELNQGKIENKIIAEENINQELFRLFNSVIMELNETPPIAQEIENISLAFTSLYEKTERSKYSLTTEKQVDLIIDIINSLSSKAAAKSINKSADLNIKLPLDSINRYTGETSLSNFIEGIKSTNNTRSCYQILTGKHACVIGIKKGWFNRNRYSFSDSNFGTIHFNNHKKMATYLTDYFKKNENIYHSEKLPDKNDYQIRYTNIELRNPNRAMTDKSEDLDLLFKNRVLAQKKEIVFGEEKILTRNAIYHNQFNQKDKIVILNNDYGNNENNFTIYSNQLDPNKLHAVITKNYDEIRKTLSNLFIDKLGNIYKIKELPRLNVLATNDEIVEKLGKPIIPVEQ